MLDADADETTEEGFSWEADGVAIVDVVSEVVVAGPGLTELALECVAEVGPLEVEA